MQIDYRCFSISSTYWIDHSIVLMQLYACCLSVYNHSEKQCDIIVELSWVRMTFSENGMDNLRKSVKSSYRCVCPIDA